MKIKHFLLIALFFLPLTQLAQSESSPEKNTGPLLGGTLGIGHLTGLNLLTGYLFDSYGISLSGMYQLDDSYGIQSNVFYKIHESENWLHSIGLVVGNSYAPPTKEREVFHYNVIGVAYSLNVYNTFWEVAFVEPLVIEGEASNSIWKHLSFQIGAAKRFY